MDNNYRSIVIAILCCMISFGNYYAYDTPAAISKQLESYWLNNSTSNEQSIRMEWMLNLYYSIYSLPNILLPLLGGFLMDRYGLHRLTMILSLLVTVGQLIFVCALVSRLSTPHSTAAWLALFGRLLFGVGGESLAVAQSTFIVRRFSDRPSSSMNAAAWVDGSDVRRRQHKWKWMSTVMGCSLAVGRMGSVLNDLISPLLASKFSVPTALWVSWGMCVVSSICVWLLIRLADRQFLETVQHLPLQQIADDNDISNDKHIAHDGMMTASAVAASAVSESVVAESAVAAGKEEWWVDNSDNDNDSERLVSGKKVKLSDVDLSAEPDQIESWLADWQQGEFDTKRNSFSLCQSLRQSLPAALWLLYLAMITTYGTVIPFNTIHAMLLQRRYSMSPVEAGQIMAVPDAISMILTPFTGQLADRYGKRIHILMSCSAMLVVTHLALALASPTRTWLIPIFPLTILGVCYSLMLLYWSIIPLLVPSFLMATAYGVGSSLMNFALCLFPLIVSSLISADGTFMTVELWFAGCAMTGMIICACLMRIDRIKLGGILSQAETA